jgi:hypothetical protein
VKVKMLFISRVDENPEMCIIICFLFLRKSGKENYIRCDYVLPDGVQHKRGMVKDPDAVRAAYRHLTESKDVAVPMQTIEEALPLTKEKLPSLAKDIVQASLPCINGNIRKQ